MSILFWPYKLWVYENNKTLFFNLTWAQNCLFQFYIWIWLEGAWDATTPTFSICLRRYEASSSPPKNLHDCWIHIKLWNCSRVNTSGRGEFTDCTESRRNTLEYAWHFPKSKLSFLSLSISGGDRRYCRQDYSARSLFFVFQIHLASSAYESSLPGQQRHQGDLFSIFCFQNLKCASQQPTRSIFSMHQCSFTSLLTWVKPDSVWDRESLALPEAAKAPIIVAVLVASICLFRSIRVHK